MASLTRRSVTKRVRLLPPVLIVRRWWWRRFWPWWTWVMTKASTHQRICQWTKHVLGTQQSVEARHELLRQGGIGTPGKETSPPVAVPVMSPDLAACRHKSPALQQGS